MKSLASCLIIIIVFSCHDSPRNYPPKGPANPWHIYDSTAQIHKYLPSGLLDSTLKTYYHFRNGQPDDRLIMLITRSHNSAGKITEESSFTHSERSQAWILDGKNIKKYDSSGNMVLEIAFDVRNSKSTMSTTTKLTYNRNNQEILRIEVRRKLDDPSNWNLDSVKAHFNDNTVPKYDTSIISSFYDSDGNLVKEIYGNREEPNREVLSTIYVHGTKKATYGINPHGDTILVYRYAKDGDLLMRTTDYRTPAFEGQTDTTWYRGNKIVKRVNIDNKMNFRMMKVNSYDEKNNEISEVNYK